MSNPAPTTSQRSRLTVALLLLVALVASACSDSSGDASSPAEPEPTVVEETPTPEPDETSTEATPEPQPTDDGTSEVENDEPAELGYLAAEDVDAYIAAYQSAIETSYVSVDGEREAIVSATPGEGLVITSASTQLQLLLGEAGIEDAEMLNSDGQWQIASEPEYSDTPGDTLEVRFSMVNVENSTESAEVELQIDFNMLGGGSSFIETRGQYALIAGTLGTSTYVQIRDIIATQPEVDTLVLTNVDGSENDEINVHTARLIREARWTTWVAANGDISSGGVDMFTAGAQRFVEPGGFVGVHSWAGSDGKVGSDFPRDHPAHQSQLEYFSEMLGDEAGPEFYFYTLEAAPAESIYRMTPEEVIAFGLTTGEPPAPLPSEIVGEFSAGYLQVLEGMYLKLVVESCTIEGNSGHVDLVSSEVGEVDITVTNGVGEMTFADLDPSLANHPVSDLTLTGGNLTASVNLNFAALFDGDTSNAQLALPCTS